MNTILELVSVSTPVLVMSIIGITCVTCCFILATSSDDRGGPDEPNLY